MPRSWITSELLLGQFGAESFARTCDRFGPVVAARWVDECLGQMRHGLRDSSFDYANCRMTGWAYLTRWHLPRAQSLFKGMIPVVNQGALPSGPLRILDIGAGTGSALTAFHHLRAGLADRDIPFAVERYVAVEPSPYMVSASRRVARAHDMAYPESVNNLEEVRDYRPNVVILNTSIGYRGVCAPEPGRTAEDALVGHLLPQMIGPETLVVSIVTDNPSYETFDGFRSKRDEARAMMSRLAVATGREDLVSVDTCATSNRSRRMMAHPSGELRLAPVTCGLLKRQNALLHRIHNIVTYDDNRLLSRCPYQAYYGYYDFVAHIAPRGGTR